MLEDVIAAVLRTLPYDRRVTVDDLANTITCAIKEQYDVNERMDYLITFGGGNWKELEALREDVQRLKNTRANYDRMLKESESKNAFKDAEIKRLETKVLQLEASHRILGDQYLRAEKRCSELHKYNKDLTEDLYRKVDEADGVTRQVNSLKKQLQELEQSNRALKESNLAFRNINEVFSRQIVELPTIHNGCTKKIKAGQDIIVFWAEQYSILSRQSDKKHDDAVCCCILGIDPAKESK